jgi:hypothetical protein
MIKLKTEFKKNGLPYQLIKRNKTVVLYGVGGNYTDKILHYEVCEIRFNEAHAMHGKDFDASESIPSNEQFGKEHSRAIVDLKTANAYFDSLTKYLTMDTKDKKTFVFYPINPILDAPILKKTKRCAVT